MKKSTFQFTDPQIVNLEYFTNEEFDQDRFEGFGINSEISTAIVEENHEAFVRLEITVGEKDPASPFFCKIGMVANFRIEEKVSPKSFQNFLDINAPALLMSYIRPIISMITSQAGFPTFNIPFVDFTDRDNVSE